jgi:hypothetical protein
MYSSQNLPELYITKLLIFFKNVVLEDFSIKKQDIHMNLEAFLCALGF